jgi:hypothetical protein
MKLDLLNNATAIAAIRLRETEGGEGLKESVPENR